LYYYPSIALIVSKRGFAMPDNFLDDIDRMLASPVGEVRQAPVEKYNPNYTEPCSACRGTGSFRSYSGRLVGPCFKCKGAGKKTFKSSPEVRAKAKESNAKAKVNKLLEVENEVEAFKVANPDVYAWLIANVDKFEFATSLFSALRTYGSLTEGQLGAAQRCVARQVENNAKREAEKVAREAAAPVADTAGVDRLKTAFDTAIAHSQAKGRGLRSPKITIGGLVISPAKETSKNPGALYVVEHGAYLGKIQGGRFFSARECTSDKEQKVLAFVADPKAAAIAYGIETGMCCICNATLTNKASIEAGIGPICAEKFGW
jgi:hypothetical protein